jgi:hypothetical protein
MTDPAGPAIGPIRQIVQGAENSPRRYLVILSGTADKPGTSVQTENGQARASHGAGAHRDKKSGVQNAIP